MSSSVPAVVWSTDLLAYKHSANHPMNPLRLELTMSLAKSLGVLDGVELIAPVSATESELLRVHSPKYTAAVKQAGKRAQAEDFVHDGSEVLDDELSPFGLGTMDNPMFPHMHESSALVAGSALTAARQIVETGGKRAISIAGGMHHAQFSSAAGFCVYNDAALAISWLLDNGYSRIAYVDVDAHHGDGVQKAFVDDPRVLTVSLHQHPATLWPTTGWPAEVGYGKAEGTAVNMPYLPGTDDSMWLRGFNAIVPSVVRQFEPEILVTQCGVDSHRDDPMADLALTVDGHREIFRALAVLADELCQGKWLALGGGGYGVSHVVPRSWTHLLAAVLDVPLAPDTPIGQQWRDSVTGIPSYPAPKTMSEVDIPIVHDPWEGGMGEVTGPPSRDRDRARVDSAILETRRSIFPLIGLDPDDPRD